MPVSRFDEQMAQLEGARLHGRRPRRGARALRRRRAAAGRRGADHVRRRLPRQPRQRRAGPAASTATRRCSSCRSRTSATAAAAAREATSPRTACTTRPSTGTRSASSSGYGVRIESHGISHKPLAELEIDEAAREIAISKLQARGAARPPGARVLVREGLRGGLQAGASEPRAPGRLRPRVHRGLRREHAGERSAAAAPLQRRAVLAAHVRARARRRVRPDRREGHRDRHARAARSSTRRSAPRPE